MYYIFIVKFSEHRIYQLLRPQSSTAFGIDQKGLFAAVLSQDVPNREEGKEMSIFYELQQISKKDDV